MPSANQLELRRLKFEINKCISTRKDGDITTTQKVKYIAVCCICNRTLTNTAISRLQAHRRVCPTIRGVSDKCSRTSSPSSQNEEDVVFTPIEVMEVEPEMGENEVEFPNNEVSIQRKSYTPSCNKSLSYITPENSTQMKKSYEDEKINEFLNFPDDMRKNEVAETNLELALFFYNCDIPFSVVNSDHFKNFIKAIRPAYSKRLPTEQMLCGILLEKVYRKCSNSKGKCYDQNPVLLLDCSNTDDSTMSIVAVMHLSTEQDILLDSWKLLNPQISNSISKIISECKKKISTTYDMKVNAIVSNVLPELLEVDLATNEWHISCNAHIGNLLLQDLSDEDFIEKVTNVLREFNLKELEQAVQKNEGDTQIPDCQSRWCNTPCVYKTLLSNLTAMQQTADEGSVTVTAETKELIFNNDFIEEVNSYVVLLDSIYDLVNSCRNKNATIADAAERWLSLDAFDSARSFLMERKNQALNVYCLTAFYLHPLYHINDKINLLTIKEQQEITRFLLKELKEDYCDVYKFTAKIGIFADLFNNNIGYNAISFWSAAKPFHQNLAKLALKLLNIPASSVQSENDLSNYDKVRKRLSKETPKKILLII